MEEKIITTIFDGPTNYGDHGSIDFENDTVTFGCGEYECEPFPISLLEKKLAEHKAKLNANKKEA